MDDIAAKMKAVFGNGPKVPLGIPEPPKPPKVDIPKKPQKGIEDITIAIQAQRLYNGNLPPAPQSVKPPAKDVLGKGTAPSMSTELGSWGSPKNEEK